MTPCEYARERHQNLMRWRNLWTILQFIFGSAVVLFLVAAILFFIRQDWLPASLATLGTVVQGVGIKWISDRRSDAVKEEEDAYRDVQTKCADTSPTDKLRDKNRILGGARL